MLMCNLQALVTAQLNMLAGTVAFFTALQHRLISDLCYSVQKMKVSKIKIHASISEMHVGFPGYLPCYCHSFPIM